MFGQAVTCAHISSTLVFLLWVEEGDGVTKRGMGRGGGSAMKA